MSLELPENERIYVTQYRIMNHSLVFRLLEFYGGCPVLAVSEPNVYLDYNLHVG